MSSDQDFLKRHPFDLHASQIENPIEDYARHIRAFDESYHDEEVQSGVPLETLFEEMTYENREIEGDLEYLTTSGFVDRELRDDGKRTFSLTEEAQKYLEDFRGRTSSYTRSVDETLRGEF